MNSDLRVQHLWTALSAEEIEDGCRFLLESSDPGGMKNKQIVLAALSRHLRFRPAFLGRRSVEENLPSLLRWMQTRESENFHDDVVRAWLVGRNRPMFVAFLEACGIPQEDGFIKGDPSAPAPSHFEAGISRVMVKFTARDVGLYLGYLLLFGGEFWSSLKEALNNKGVRIPDLLVVQTASPNAADASPAAIDMKPASSEDSDDFTTLDNWLIRAAVASAFGESGAHTSEQLEDLVEEVVSLNAQRQHSLFHRGYLHALFGKPFAFHFPGENEERRLWYFTGSLFGLLRSRRNDEVVRLLRENADISGQLCESRKVRCGSMLLPQLVRILWEAKEFGMCQRWLEHQLARLPSGRATELIIQVHYDASSMVRRGQWAEAEGFLSFLDDYVRGDHNIPNEFAEWFLPANDRKRAQVFQLKGEFQGAEALLKPLSERNVLDDGGNALCDLALISCGFRSMAAVLPTKDEQASQITLAALSRSHELLVNAVKRNPTAATNAHFCLGLMAVLARESGLVAADHLKAALAGMLKKEEAYSENGFIQWTGFLLGLALLESAELPEFQYARDRIEQAMQTPVVFPIWLWSRAMQAAALFDDHSLGKRIAEHLLQKRGRDANKAIWQSGLARSVSSLRETYLAWMGEAQLPLHEKWEQLKALLPAALREPDSGHAESILDEMEGLAVQGAVYRTEFLKLLRDDRQFSPAWTIAEADNVRIKLHVLEGNLAEAVSLLRARYFALREQGDPVSLREASATLDWMANLGADDDDVVRLRALLPTDEEESTKDECPLKAGTAIYVLYIGGNETQQAYELAIREELSAKYPGLKVEFYYPGWDSNWNVHLDKLRPKIFQADAVVLNRLVRTEFGRHVRAICNSRSPWFPCTGKGKQSLKRSIEYAALEVAKQKSRL